MIKYKTAIKSLQDDTRALNNTAVLPRKVNDRTEPHRRAIDTGAKLRLLAKQLVKHRATRGNYLLAGKGAHRLVVQRGWIQQDDPGGSNLIELPKW